MVIGPFKIVPDGPGLAAIIDNATGREVGYVVQYTPNGPWQPKVMGWEVADPCKYRRDAAWKVWEHRRRQVVETRPL